MTHNHERVAGGPITGGLGSLPRDHTLENRPKFLLNEFALTPLGQNRRPIDAESYQLENNEVGFGGRKGVSVHSLVSLVEGCIQTLTFSDSCNTDLCQAFSTTALLTFWAGSFSVMSAIL